jgi:hypothetical protein
MASGSLGGAVYGQRQAHTSSSLATMTFRFMRFPFVLILTRDRGLRISPVPRKMSSVACDLAVPWYLSKLTG